MSNKGFSIPDLSITKKEEPEGSAAWMKSAAKEHGDTDPQKLEKRREKVSVFAAMMDKSLQALQLSKKQYLLRNQKLQENLAKSIAKMQSEGTPIDEAGRQMADLQMERIGQEQQYEMLINQQITNMAMVEGLCLIVDSLTLRESVKSKSGKKGMVRYSVALYSMDTALHSIKFYNRMKKLYDLMAAQNPKLAASLDAVDDEGDENEETYEDEDVVSDDDRKKIRDEAGVEI